MLTWHSISHFMTESPHLSALEMALNAILAAVHACYGNTHLYRGALVTHLLIQLSQGSGCSAGVWVSMCSSTLVLQLCGG